MGLRLLLLALALGCAEELTLPPEPVDAADPDDDPDPSEHPPWWRPLDDDGSVLTVRIDATVHDTWRPIDLTLPGPIAVDDLATSVAWHLAVRRFHLAINGGVSGPGGIEAAFVEGATIDGPISVPADGWRTDVDAPDTDPPTVEHALGDWYHYDPSTHVLTPRPGVFVLRSAEAAWAVRVDGYYDDAGNSGFPTLRLRALDR